MSDRQTSNGSSRPSSEASLFASIAYRTANPYEIGVAYIDGEPLRPLGRSRVGRWCSVSRIPIP